MTVASDAARRRAVRRAATPVASGAPTRTRCSRARRCSWSPTGWAARRPARSPRGSPSSPSSRARRTPPSPSSRWPRSRAPPTRASTSCRTPTPSRRAWARRSPPSTSASEEVAIAHVGDSRAYCLRDGELLRLTDDHSLVDELMRQGRLTPEEAVEHPQRSVITRALGPEGTVEVDTRSFERAPGDVYLLCSDGLTTMISEEQIAAVLLAHPPPARRRRGADRGRQRGRRARQHHGRAAAPRGGRAAARAGAAGAGDDHRAARRRPRRPPRRARRDAPRCRARAVADAGALARAAAPAATRGAIGVPA